MDRTSITLGSETRDALREYKHDRELSNYDEAVRDLLQDGAHPSNGPDRGSF
ncbi:hypothetical protein ACFQAS_15650 [Halopenitus salinus]|uniref:CopG family transcriptional regulator n=1 Tax=Halopenitus salinus TaxID=1198295 RepID=A0ABD5USY9_9EURY